MSPFKETSMAFRADEAARQGREEVESYLIPRPRDLEPVERERSRAMLSDLLEELGPVVDAYPMWHPLVAHDRGRDPVTHPVNGSGYEGLDHTCLFANGFVTCPYGDGSTVLESVARLPRHHSATISARVLDIHFYAAGTTPVLVTCEWHRPLNPDGTIPVALAVPLLLEKELPAWEWAQVAETWESMRPYILGKPHGAVSSLFINQEGGQAIKKLWNALIDTGMFGPIRP